MRSLMCHVEGRFAPLDEAGIPLNDLGLQRGYGIFDFLRVNGRTPLFIEDHLDRFYSSAATMRLTVPETRERLSEIIHELVGHNSLPSSGIRILLTGGPSPDGYAISSPRLAVIHQAMAAPPDEMPTPGIRLCSHPYRRQLPEVKTTDYLMAVWLQPWLRGQGGDDILYHHGGIVSECPRSNLFIVDRSGVLATPARDMLKGVTRKQVIALALRLGIPLEERDIRLEEVAEASEAFVTASTKRVLPVCRIDEIPIPSPVRESVTRRLRDALIDLERSILP
jgi:D-alanine transaminase/branched-chain amino acid aminotransferase